MLDRDVFRVQRDGLHDVVQTPEFQAALDQAISNYFGARAPGLLDQLRRFVAKAEHNSWASFNVGTAAGAANNSADPGRVKLLERDESRIEAVIFNLGAATVYIGGRQVTTGPIGDANAGLPILSQTGYVWDSTVDELWCVSGTPGQDVRVNDKAGAL